MYQVNINDSIPFSIELNDSKMLVNGKEVSAEIVSSKKNSFSVIRENKTFEVEVLKIDRSEKIVRLKINNKETQVTLKSDLDQLLEKLGMDQSSSQSMKDLKAPMPGLILEIAVSAGDDVKKGQPLIILEAMKMENVIKAQGEGTIKNILVNEKESVEKNQVLIQF